MRFFDAEDVGVYIDGSYGEEHRRKRLAEMMVYFQADQELIDSLKGNSPDDYSDEDEAIDILRGHTENGLTWILECGDLILMKDEEN